MSDADSNFNEFVGDSDSYSGIEYNNSSLDGSDDSDGTDFVSIDDEDIDPDHLVEETRFADEQDAEAFRGISKHHYRVIILPLKNMNFPFFNYNFHSQLSDKGKIRLGGFLARADGLTQLHVTLKEEQPQSVGLVFRGPFQQDHALRRLKIGAGDDVSFAVKLSVNDWSCFSRYLRKAPSLRHLDLNYLTLGRAELENLASALQGIKLKTLGLSEVNNTEEMGEDDSLGILFTSMNPTDLETIDIVGCSVGVSECEGLANILRNKESKLEILNLDANPIDDDCVELLCKSLVGNTSLTILHLNNEDEDITDEGWKLFEKLVFDKSNLESIYQSNHTLRCVVGHPRPELIEVKEAQRAINKGHAKILTFLTNNKSGFNIEPFIGFDVEMMPHVLEFFGTDIRLNLSGSWPPLSLLYEIIRWWNVPELFSFPSAEKVRLSTRMNKLETENHGLVSEIEKLRAENSRLASEVNQFKSEKNESSNHERHQNSKRSRLD
mmetsp:Transcript_29561/g.62712  ORF Transcript_29561/g.62712 Transcript_29561/m.62712 type:complete len:494 (+) Transcript_29561:56-1537(+)